MANRGGSARDRRITLALAPSLWAKGEARGWLGCGRQRAIGRGDREFLPAALELVETPPSPIRMTFVWCICIGFASLLAWSYFSWIDIHAVAQGKIQPSGRSKVVQPLEPGRVVAIHVENGVVVRAGDVLLELDPTETTADRDAQKRDLDSTNAEIVRRRAAIEIARNGTSHPTPIAFMAGTEESVRAAVGRPVARASGLGRRLWGDLAG